MDINEILNNIPTDRLHNSKVKCLCLEMTHNLCNGNIPSLDFVKQCQKVCKDNKLKMHLDGARVFNAIVGLNIEP